MKAILKLTSRRGRCCRGLVYSPFARRQHILAQRASASFTTGVDCYQGACPLEPRVLYHNGQGIPKEIEIRPEETVTVNINIDIGIR